MPAKILLLFISLLITSYCCDARPRIDSTYIGTFSQDFAITPYVYNQYLSLTHNTTDNNYVTYMPNTPVGIGIGIQYKSFSISGGYGFNFMRDKKMGTTKGFDFQYHYYGRKFIFDLFYQNYKGFYVDDTPPKADDPVYTLYPDIKLAQYGISGQYVFNSRRFSYRAAFNQNEKQLRSAGSPQIGGGIFFNRINEVENLLEINGTKDLIRYQISLSGGYVYIFIIKKKFFLSIGLSAGVNFGSESIGNWKETDISPCIFPRFAMGYNGKKWSLGISSVNNYMYLSMHSKQNLLFNTVYAKITYIQRLNVSPLLFKKIKMIN